MTVAVLIPYQAGGPERARALFHVFAHYEQHHRRWDVLFGELPAGVPWCKAEAIALARARTDADVLVVADADVLLDPATLWRATKEVADKDAGVGTLERSRTPWAVPHARTVRLDAASTRQLYDTGELPEHPGFEPGRPPYKGGEGGGCVVLGADLYDRVPLDPRFTGWGSEDIAWGRALRCLAGPPWRPTSARMWHLWHPSAHRGQSRSHNAAGRELDRRYARHRSDPRGMRQLLDEIA